MWCWKLGNTGCIQASRFLSYHWFIFVPLSRTGQWKLCPKKLMINARVCALLYELHMISKFAPWKINFSIRWLHEDMYPNILCVSAFRWCYQEKPHALKYHSFVFHTSWYVMIRDRTGSHSTSQNWAGFSSETISKYNIHVHTYLHDKLTNFHWWQVFIYSCDWFNRKWYWGKF